MSSLSCDVLVVGGGPAGSTAAALLAREGLRVTLLEKDVHPRFHIGESLLPANVPLFEALGVAEEVAAIGMPKLGVEFVAPDHPQPSALRFTDAWDKSLAGAFQVRRSEFDHLLIRNAARQGADVREGHRVRRVEFAPRFGGATAEVVGPDGAISQWQARFVIDASGRDTLLGNQFRQKRKNPRHASAAVFGHFVNAKRHPGDREGDITIYWFAHGWFWFIPLADGTTSVGAVCWPYYLKSRRKPLPEFFADTIAMCPKLAERLADARPAPGHEVHATGNYSYDCTVPHGAAREASYLLAGDAYAFIDPVFSSGVFLAMNSAFRAADAVRVALATPERTAAAMRDYERDVVRGPKEYAWFIERMTQPGIRELFLHPRNVFRAREAVMSVLAGDLFRGTPIGPSLFAFKFIYYLNLLRRPVRTWRSLNQRRINIQDEPIAG